MAVCAACPAIPDRPDRNHCTQYMLLPEKGGNEGTTTNAQLFAVNAQGTKTVRFRRRDTELAPVRYDGVTYLILQAASEGAGELNYSAVIEPRPDRQFCLPDSFREIRYPASCPIVFAGDWRDRLFLREHRVGRTRPHRISD
jgi:hypothetical protein